MNNNLDLQFCQDILTSLQKMLLQSVLSSISQARSKFAITKTSWFCNHLGQTQT